MLQWQEALRCQDLAVLPLLAWELYPLNHAVCKSDPGVFDILFHRLVSPGMILNPFVS